MNALAFILLKVMPWQCLIDEVTMLCTIQIFLIYICGNYKYLQLMLGVCSLSSIHGKVLD
jgi:hypothetical protein